jgi:putative glutamine amidotransferase
MQSINIGITDCSKFQNYKEWFADQPGVAVIQLAYHLDSDVNLCDGILFTGGTDIHPGFYGSKKKDYIGHPEQFDEKRDEFEISVFESTQKRDIPVLAVCRGLQLVNCILGGTLKQNLGFALNRIHCAERSLIDPRVKNDKAHGVNIEPGTIISEIAGVERSVVNSAHHQAVNKLGSRLKVNCRSDDGTVEGLEWEDKSGNPFLLAVQWHPERMSRFQLENSPLSKKIRERFIDEIKKKKK